MIMHVCIFSITLCYCAREFIPPRPGGETRVSPFHMMVGQKTVCGMWVLQCSQNVRRRLETTGQVLVSRTYVRFVQVHCRVPHSGAAFVAYSLQISFGECTAGISQSTLVKHV